jgi:uncharacterized membrane protein HdeD (DUF308 family)
MAVAAPPHATPDAMQEGLRRLGAHWGWILSFGLVTLTAGVVAVAWPDRTVLVVAVLFGIHLIFTGVFRLVAAFASSSEGGLRWVLSIVGVLGIIVGILCLQNVIQTVAVMTIFLGLYWIFDGLVHLVVAITDSDMQDRGLAIGTGLLSAAAGIAVLAYPGSSLFFLTMALGLWLMFFGVLQVVVALRVRKLAMHASTI